MTQNTDFKDYYGTDESFLTQQKQRYKKLTEQFEKKYNSTETNLFRAPGRVNLIGEHTDYNGYPVMPMAINRDVVLAVKQRKDNLVRIANVERDFGDREFTINENISPYQTGDWGNYVKAAIVGLVPTVKNHTSDFCGFDAMVCGSIPPAGGLSSSSAMVVASALVFLWANNVSLSKIELAEILAKAERFVGTEGGGMDQAISLMGKSGKAVKIDFFPLRAEPVQLSEDVEIVITNSLTRAPKTEAAMNEYNRRPVECRIGAALIQKELKSHGINLENVQRLVDVKRPVDINQTEYDLIVEKALSQNIFSSEEICIRLGLEEKTFVENYLLLKSGKTFSPPAEGFKIKQRYQHVISEANRVEKAAKSLRNGDIKHFGKMMDESHKSCRNLYEISIDELDSLVSICKKNDALGARLTGAGFGGCVVSLVPKLKVGEFKKGVISDYYKKYLREKHPHIKIPFDDMDTIIFNSPAMQGAGEIK